MVIHSSKLVYPRELYQRGVERKRVELIAAHFNEYVANEPKVSFRNGQFIVTDGQHTIEGRILRNGGKDLPILCKVYTGMTVEQEALLFAEQNGFSAPLTAGIKLRAKVVGGDAISKAFLAATNRVGLSLNYDSQQLTDYRIGCVGTAFRLYKQMGEPLYCETMRLIVAAWEGKPDSFRASVLKGMMHFVELYHASSVKNGYSVRCATSTRSIFTASGRTTPKSCADGKNTFSPSTPPTTQVQKRRTADEILIFSGIPPIYTRGIRKPQMPLVTYQSAIYSVPVFIQHNI